MFFSAKPLQIKLKRLLLLIFVLLLLPMLLIQMWLALNTAQETALRFQRQLASEVSARVYDRVLQFFAVPEQVVLFNLGQFEQHMIDTRKPSELKQNFLLQLKQQPYLTFISVITAKGEYYAASRPPLGEGPLRFMEVSASTQYRLVQTQASPDGLGQVLAMSEGTYDPRHWPWFSTATNKTTPYWYGAYPYWIDTPDNAYQAMGMGMAAPLYTKEGKFVGVLTADVALDQLDRLLADIAKGLGGVVFLFDQNALLLASSSAEAFQLNDQHKHRLAPKESPNPLIRKAWTVIAQDGQSQGRVLGKLGPETYLFDWWEYPLPGGPTIAIANMLPKSQFEAPLNGLFTSTFLYSLLLLGVFVFLAIWMSRWVSKPLSDLGDWAEKLDYDRWDKPNLSQGPIKEVNSLTRALNFMAEKVRHYTEHLKDEVSKRTQELEAANKELQARSNTDSLTGLFNRRAFDEALSRELMLAARLKQPLALLMLDVDHFKRYNDLYGHLGGDSCLKQVAQVLSAHTHRPTDFVARYGGEEFAVILAHSNPEGAKALAEKLRQALEDKALLHALNPGGKVTASFGVAVIYPSAQSSSEDLIELADQALYQAKEEGRNRVVFKSIV